MTVYGGLHYYLYRKLRHALPAYKYLSIIALSLLGGSVFVVEALLHNEIVTWAKPLAWLSFVWMGWVVLFFGISLPLDIIAWLAKKIALVSSMQHLVRQPGKFLTSRLCIFLVIIVTTILGIYGTLSARQINFETIPISSAKLPQPIRLIQISDLHLGILTNPDYIARLVQLVNAKKPDIIVSTGDLIDMSTDNAHELTILLEKLKAPLGKYAVYGNHETFVDLDKSRTLTESAGFTLLSNSGVTIAGIINLFGVDDPSVAGRMHPGAQHPREPHIRFANALFTVLLKHQPVVTPATVPTFDLQLSGHVHGGQIYPFGLITAAVYRVPLGLSRITDNRWLYVSRGTGTWGPPMRVLAKPEITVFELHPQTHPN